MESQVFGYFVAIGSGLSVGITLGAIPALLIWQWMKRRGERGYDVHQVKKARS